VIGKKAGGCAVALWAKLHDHATKDSTDVGGWLTFKAGDAMHEAVQAALVAEEMAATGWVVVGVEKWATHRGLNGRIDLLLLHMETGQKLIVDIKSKNSNFFKWAKTKPADVLQVQFYMEAEDAEFGMILYVDREGKFDPIQREVDRADERVEKGLERISELQRAETQDDLPEWVEFCTGSDWQVRYCNLESCLCARREMGDTSEDDPEF
jgi:hypothetical protein